MLRLQVNLMKMDKSRFSCPFNDHPAKHQQKSTRIDKPRIKHNTISSEIFSYPSIGGLVRKRSITRVELDWLGIVPDETQASHEEEDNLSLRMLQIGAHWWPSKELYDNHNWEDYPYGHHYPPDLDIGYPRTGGVLVLRTWAPNSPYLAGLPDAALEKPDNWSRLSLCASMEERCAVLREFGAVMYDSVEECPCLPSSLEEGIAQGKEYEVLLKKMEDREYLDQWLCSL